MPSRAHHRLLIAALLPLVALAIGGVQQPAVGQDARPSWPQPQATPLATERPPARTAPLPSPSDGAREAETQAIVLYAEARAALDAGDLSQGQRRLEQLVGRYPDSVTASVARRDLNMLYTRAQAALQPPREAAPAPPIGQPTPAPAPTRPASSLAPSGPVPVGHAPPAPPAPLHVPRADRSSEVVEMANEELRHAAGDRLFFADSSADFGGRSRVVVEAMADWLKSNPGVEVVVEGHADDRGTAAFNNEMAERRAEAVRLRLIDSGIAPQRIAAVAVGKDHPIADCREPQCTAQNRRVVVVVTKVAGNLQRPRGGLRPDLRSLPLNPDPAGRDTQSPGSGVTAVRR